MKMTLPSGTEARVFVSHSSHDVQPRHTALTVYLGTHDEQVFSAVATCSTKDQFCRRTGRHLAAKRVREQMRLAGVSAQDRSAIYYKVYPEGAPKA